MFKGFMLIGVFVISVVLLVGTNASAGCIPLGGGGLLCADWLTGSEICAVLVATTGATSKGKTPSLDCGYEGCEVTCTVAGTVKEQTSKDGTSKHRGEDSGKTSCKAGSEDCALRGFAFCEASTHPSPYDDVDKDEKDKDKDKKPSIVRHPLLLTEDNADLPLQATKEFKDQNCKDKQNGGSVCLTSIELDPDPCHDCCPEHFAFITFTAQEFVAEVKVCPGTHGSGECVRLMERCKVDPDAIKFGKSALYTCKPLKGGGAK